MKRMKWIIAVAIAIPVLLMTGCGSSTTVEEEVSDQSDQGTTTETQSNEPETTTETVSDTQDNEEKETTGPGFSFSNFKVLKAEVEQGIDTAISVVVTNNGDSRGSFTVEFKINGNVEDHKDVTLDSGKSETVFFSYSTQETGEYTASVGEYSGQFTVIPEIERATWQIPEGSGEFLRAVHMGGNWGTNTDSVIDPPKEYFEYLRDLNVNWVGISQALHVDGSMDSTVEFVYDGVPQASWTDETLQNLIHQFRRHGFNVYLHVAFEDTWSGDMGFDRYLLGNPFAPSENPEIEAENWPWSIDHPQHSEFVAEFWETYTDCLVHIAEIAESEGVGMMTVGTETDGLFRTSARGMWPNDFLEEIQTMVTSVRSVYSGLLSYEMLHFTLEQRYLYGPADDDLYSDAGFDFLALSAYFSLTDTAPESVLSMEDLEDTWDDVFTQHIMPWVQRNPGKKIIFTEFGATDVIECPWSPSHEQFVDKEFEDSDGNGLDDGEEAQARYIESLFNIMETYPGVVTGAFLWDVMMSTQDVYDQGFGQMRTFNIREKIAEDMVRERYADWMN